MEDIFKPHSLTIKKLFGDTDALYQIPNYQRPYSWNTDQLEKLWDDLTESFQSDEPAYFLGSVITAKSAESTNKYLDIVDGQQRLTTLQIMFCVVRDLFPSLNEDLLETDFEAIDNKVVKTSIKYNDRFERLRLRTHDAHFTSFKNLILKEGATLYNQTPSKKELKNSENPHFKFQNTSAFFLNKFQEIGEKNSGEFINHIFNKVNVIRIDCSDVSFAIKLFQVLNDRGLDLSNADLIKSFLIGEIRKRYELDQELFTQHQNQFISDWQFCEQIAFDTEETLNDLFVLYQYALLAQNPKKSLSEELQILLKGKDPNEVIGDFKTFIESYKTQIIMSDNPHVFGFRYIRWATFWKSIFLSGIYYKHPDFEKFSFIFKRYYYLNWIAGNSLNKIKQTSFNIIKWLKNHESLEFINTNLEKNLAEYGTIQKVKEALKGDIYGETWCKPLLFLIEYNAQDRPAFFRMDDRNIHVEHILPQAYSKNKDWESFHNQLFAEKTINTGANLTLLSGKKNIDAKNYGFETKIGAYNGTGYHDKNDRRVTSFKITQDIVNDYNSGIYNKEWNIEAIKTRWNWFISETSAILNIDLEDLKDSLKN
ncbi:MAG TPA: DUF262 domain-containing HNH endonuclease family protein [Leadbetterella sp.]|nr:DUF262 domain-containing HNH endonuclease family protein [Leadbetterella sp.]